MTETLRVLVADDDDDQRFLLRRLFARIGIDNVVEAADGEEALRAAADRPELIVLDLAMPVLSGFEALPALRAAAPDARIVVLSNFPMRRMADAVRQRGAVGYVQKQATTDGLVHQILLAAELVASAAARASTGRLPAEARSAGSARRFIRDVLDAAGDDVVGAVELLVSELVTNAVIHASSEPQVDVHVNGAMVRVEVHDDDSTLPTQRTPDLDAPGGRGLLLLDRMASRWGAEPHGDGKVVWFELDRV